MALNCHARKGQLKKQSHRKTKRPSAKQKANHQFRVEALKARPAVRNGRSLVDQRALMDD